MLRSSLLAAGAIALAAGAGAQTATPQLKLSRDVQRVQGAVKHAGTYHVSTGTWTRARGNQANIGPDVVYNNSLGSGYFFGGMSGAGTLSGLEWLGTGNVPTAASNGSFATQPDRTSYTINCFEFGYCDTGLTPASSNWQFKFYDSASPCVDATVAPVKTLTFNNLPTGGCWTVNFDLTGATPQEFCLEGDGGQLNPGWDLDDPILDSFGFSLDLLSASATGAAAGVLLTGDPDSDDNGYDALNPNSPAACNPAGCPAAPAPTAGNGTYFNPAGLCAAVNAGSIAANAATGRLTRDFWLATDANTATSGAPEGCYYFGGYFNTTGCNTASNTPYAAAYLILAAAAGECTGGGGTPIGGGTAYCNSNPNSTGATSVIDINGFQEAALNNCVLRASSLPLNTFGFFITSRNPGFTANPAGSRGNICLGANIGRFISPGQIKNSGATGVIEISTLVGPGQWNLGAIPTATGPYAAAAGITSHFQLWHRDVFNGAATSNFTGGKRVTWL